MKEEHIGFYIPSHPPAHRYSMFPSILLGKACGNIKAPPDTICQKVQDICKTIFALAKSTRRIAELLDMVNNILFEHGILCFHAFMRWYWKHAHFFVEKQWLTKMNEQLITQKTLNKSGANPKEVSYEPSLMPKLSLDIVIGQRLVLFPLCLISQPWHRDLLKAPGGSLIRSLNMLFFLERGLILNSSCVFIFGWFLVIPKGWGRRGGGG